MQGTLLSTITFPEFVDLVRRNFDPLQNMIVPKSRQLFIYDNIGKGQGNSKIFHELDTETFANNKPQGVAAQAAKYGVGYNKTMFKKRVAKEVRITQEMRDENRYMEVGNLITNLSWFVPQRIELDGTHRLTFSDSVSYTDLDGDTVDVTTGDGLSLINAAHTLKFSALTYSNRVAGDPIFSQGALESAVNLTVSNILSNFGERRVLMFNSIITSDDETTKNAVKKLLRSTADPQSSNYGAYNVYEGAYNHVILPYLATTPTGARDSTKRFWWFLGAIGQGMNGWQAYFGEWEAPHMNELPSAGNNGVDSSRDIWKFGARGGYGYVCTTGKGIVGSLPTST